ncbi:MAG TPA: DUF1232 domain-containing protein [Acidobacteriota bacterium]|nr:DUF1232 domain-containing protein [Acidobacteriota bacterium]
MDEATHLPDIESSHLDSTSEDHEVSQETLKERAIRYVKELGYFVRLFFSLLLDERVDGKVKVFVASVLAYVISPVDFIPELFSGLFGMLDDFVLSAFALNVLLNWIDPEIIKSHWKGKSDLLVTVQKAMKNAELLVPDAILKKIEGWIGRHAAKAVATVVANPPERKRP